MLTEVERVYTIKTRDLLPADCFSWHDTQSGNTENLVEPIVNRCKLFARLLPKRGVQIVQRTLHSQLLLLPLHR